MECPQNSQTFYQPIKDIYCNKVGVSVIRGPSFCDGYMYTIASNGVPLVSTIYLRILTYTQTQIFVNHVKKFFTTKYWFVTIICLK